MLARALREIHAGPMQVHGSAGVGVIAIGDTGARAGPEGKGHRSHVDAGQWPSFRSPQDSWQWLSKIVLSLARAIQNGRVAVLTAGPGVLQRTTEGIWVAMLLHRSNFQNVVWLAGS